MNTTKKTGVHFSGLYFEPVVCGNLNFQRTTGSSFQDQGDKFKSQYHTKAGLIKITFTRFEKSLYTSKRPEQHQKL